MNTQYKHKFVKCLKEKLLFVSLQAETQDLQDLKAQMGRPDQLDQLEQEGK